MAFPPDIINPRAKENRPGIVYDSSRKSDIFVEDIELLEDNIADIETYLNGEPWDLGYTPEDVANKKLDLSDNSDTFYPSQKAVKTAVDAKVNKSSVDCKFRAYRSGQQSNLVNATPTKVQFNAENYDEGSDFDHATNYRFTAPSTGKYHFDYQVWFENCVADKGYGLYLKKNNTTVVSYRWNNTSNATDCLVQGSDTLALSENDYIELFAFQYSGGDTVDVKSNSEYTYFAGFRLPD